MQPLSFIPLCDSHNFSQNFRVERKSVEVASPNFLLAGYFSSSTSDAGKSVEAEQEWCDVLVLQWLSV